MAHARKPPRGAKNLPKISYASRVIANFVPNFVAMATGVGRGKIKSAAFDGPSQKTPQRREKSRGNLLRKPSYSPFSHKFRCHGNRGQSGKNAIGSIRWPISQNPLWAQKSPENLLRKPSYSQFCPKFRCHGNEGPSSKTRLYAHKSRKNLLHEASYSQFCPKFCCHGNWGRSGKNAIGSIRRPIPEKTPYARKNLPKISYASPVVAHLVTNFVAMATGVGRGKMQSAAFDGPSPKTPL